MPFWSSLASLFPAFWRASSQSKSALRSTTPDSTAPKHASPLLHPVIAEFQKIIEEDPSLFMGFHQIFEEIPDDPRYKLTSTGQPQVQNYLDMLEAIQTVLTRSPEFGDEETGDLAPAPLNAILNWPMNTPAGLRVFTHAKVNAQLQKILTVWSEFLCKPESRYVLTADHSRGWFSPAGLNIMRNDGDDEFHLTYICDPSKEYHGFKSWDDFFTRKFRPGVRPIAAPRDDSIVISACESVPYKISYDVEHTSSFWLKGETYSLSHMLASDPLTPQFVGGTVYQAYLSSNSYHRWHTPVSGRIVKIVDVPGTYCAISPSTGFDAGEPDDAAPNNSQAFLSNIATRMIMFIQADNEDIGLMAFIAVGMVEVSSCESTVKVGQRVKKGDELGMFHYGGSTHCLIFRPQTKVVFDDRVMQALDDKKTKLLLNTPVACVSKKDT